MSIGLSFLVIIGTVSVTCGLKISHQLNTVVKYLGEDYYLKDGCPLPDCDDRERGCFKRQIELKKKFNGCYSGPSGKYMGCETQHFPSGGKIVFPVFAKYCSKMCYYDGDDEKMEQVHYCPANGTRNDEVDEALQKEMNRKDPTTTTTTERIIENPDRTIGLSTLIDDKNEITERRQGLGRRPVAFSSFNRSSHRQTFDNSNSLSTTNRAPRRQNSQLDKTLHQLIEEGFFPSNRDSDLTSNDNTDPPPVPTSTAAPTTTPISASENLEDLRVVRVSSSVSRSEKDFPPLADASTLLELNNPEEISFGTRLKPRPLVSS